MLGADGSGLFDAACELFFSGGKKVLYPLKILLADDGGMRIFYAVFWLLPMIEDHVERDGVGSEGLVPHCISSVRGIP